MVLNLNVVGCCGATLCNGSGCSKVTFVFDGLLGSYSV